MLQSDTRTVDAAGRVPISAFGASLTYRIGGLAGRVAVVSAPGQSEETRDAWEYASIGVHVSDGEKLMKSLNNAGATGWELVSLTDSESLFGSPRLVAVLKRRIDPFNPPGDRSAGWKHDPSERHQYRWWDGQWWTFSVADGDEESRDPPTRLTPARRVQ